MTTSIGSARVTVRRLAGSGGPRRRRRGPRNWGQTPNPNPRYSRRMIEPARHVPLRPIPWNESEAQAAIEDIVADGLEHFDAERFWPAHPLDEGIRDGHTSFYFGATGMIWGIDYLGRLGATKARFDFRPVLPRLLETSQAEFAKWK